MPEVWTNAHVTALYKNKGEKSDTNNSRPDSLTSVPSVLDVLDYWNKSADEGKQVDTINLDIRKAFDSISHRRLLQKLEAYGIEGEVLEWVRDFLKGRRQTVMLNGKSSDWMDVSSGVPQRSVLGRDCLLFILTI